MSFNHKKKETPKLTLPRDRKGKHEYANIKIVCQGKEFYVHEVVVCPRCEYFKTAIKDAWQQSATTQSIASNASAPKEPKADTSTRVIELSDEDGALEVELFLDALYDADSTVPIKSEVILTTWAKVYILGGKLLAPVPREKALRMMQQLDKATLAPPDITESLSLIYCMDAASALLLRRECQPIIAQRKNELMGLPEFKELIDLDNDLGKDFARFVLNSKISLSESSQLRTYRYVCTKCWTLVHSNRQLQGSKPGPLSRCCPSCGCAIPPLKALGIVVDEE